MSSVDDEFGWRQRHLLKFLNPWHLPHTSATPPSPHLNDTEKTGVMCAKMLQTAGKMIESIRAQRDSSGTKTDIRKM